VSNKSKKAVCVLLALVSFVLANIYGEPIQLRLEGELVDLWVANSGLCLLGWVLFIVAALISSKKKD
jgi:hypothetical protein